MRSVLKELTGTPLQLLLRRVSVPPLNLQTRFPGPCKVSWGVLKVNFDFEGFTKHLHDQIVKFAIP